MRKQTVKINTGMKKNLIIIIAMAVLLLAVLFFGYHFLTQQNNFVAPEFEKSAVQGTPSPEESLRYDSVSSPTGFSVALCGTMYQQKDQSLILYLTNPKVNMVNIRCKIKNENNEIIYKSGVLRPGEYVEKLSPLIDFPNKATKIKIIIYGYEPDTWYSNGTLELENTLQPY